MFRSHLILTDNQPHKWTLVEPLVWSDERGTITVPARFVTDLASVPVGLRNLLDINGKSRKPAVLHDYLYCSQSVTRAQADRYFYDALRAEGASMLLAATYYAGVRAGGWVAWKHKRACQVALV